MAGGILRVEYNILLSRSLDKICCIVKVELHPEYNNPDVVHFTIKKRLKSSWNKH